MVTDAERNLAVLLSDLVNDFDGEYTVAAVIYGSDPQAVAIFAHGRRFNLTISTVEHDPVSRPS